jgi:hypothetical protein
MNAASYYLKIKVGLDDTRWFSAGFIQYSHKGISQI